MDLELAANWRFAAKQFVKRYPEELVVHCSESNYSSLTFDGVDVMGERLAKEVLSVVESRPELRKISFVSHSLGGLVARYAIGRLYTENDQRDPPEENGDCKACNGERENRRKGRIAGLEPVNFITFATPHLGSWIHKQIPILRGSTMLEKMAYRISWIAGRTGKHLFLKDHDEGKPPLLLQMVNDYGDLRFMSALQSFYRRVAYSNVCYDLIVGWKTSSIRHQHELPKRQNFIKNERYPHIVYEEKPKSAILGHEEFMDTTVFQQMTTAEMEEAMIRDLNKVTWERVDVSFRKSKQKIFAHSAIQDSIGAVFCLAEEATEAKRTAHHTSQTNSCLFSGEDPQYLLTWVLGSWLFWGITSITFLFSFLFYSVASVRVRELFYSIYMPTTSLNQCSAGVGSDHELQLQACETLIPFICFFSCFLISASNCCVLLILIL